MDCKLSIAFVGVADHELTVLFRFIQQQQFEGELINHVTLSDLIKVINVEQTLPALIVLYFRETALLAPKYLHQLRSFPTLVDVPVVVYANSITAQVEQELEALEVYASLHKPTSHLGMLEHGQAFMHMCKFWHKHFAEYTVLRTMERKGRVN